MFELRVLELAFNKLRTDPQLLSILGENFEVFPLFSEKVPKFPFIVHKVNTKYNNDPVVKATYCLDVWDFGLDRARMYAAVRRIRKLLESYMDSQGGGIRFFCRTCDYSTQKEKIQRAELTFHVRGVDKDQCTDD